MNGQEHQLSRYGAIARIIPDLAPGAKVFLVSDSDDTTVGPMNLGDMFPVDNSGVARVYTTIQDACNAASATRGDVVLVMPGYDQTLSRNDTWATAGVSIIGLGGGEYRPIVRYTAKTDRVDIKANNVRVSNIKFLAAADSIAAALVVDTGFTGVKIDNNVFDFNATTNDFRRMLTVKSRRTLVENNRFIAEDTAGAGSAISLLGGDASFSTIRNNFIYGQYDTVGDTTNGAGAIVQDTTDTADTNVSGLLIEGNKIINTDTAAAIIIRFSTGFTNRGLVANNVFGSYDSSAADTTKVIGAGLKFANNIIATADSSTEKRVGDTIVVAS